MHLLSQPVSFIGGGNGEQLTRGCLHRIDEILLERRQITQSGYSITGSSFGQSKSGRDEGEGDEIGSSVVG